MGETTYNYVHGNSTGSNPASGSLQGQQVASPHILDADQSITLLPADLNGLFTRASQAKEFLQSAIKTNLDSPGGYHTPALSILAVLWGHAGLH